MKSSVLDNLMGGVALGGILVAAIFVGNAFRAHFHALMGCTLSLWISLPLLTTLLGRVITKQQSLERARTFSTATAGALSFLVFTFAERPRDAAGRRFLSGFVSYREWDVDEFGRDYLSHAASATGWIGSIAIPAIEWGIIAACVLVPVLTWTKATRVIEATSRNRSTG